jgi:class 3 adenylate cyclase
VRAPLEPGPRHRDHPRGLPDAGELFHLNDLDLLTALANYAAVAVERARLNQKIVAEEKKRERLGRFLSPQVTARIIATSGVAGHGPGRAGGEGRQRPLLDIVGFTTMSEKMSPAAVSLLLNDYFSRMTDIIFKYEGTLDKYIGDAIMAVFGAPLDMPDHCVRAIKAALEMRDQLEAFNAEHKEGPTIRIRIGINSGKAMAGELGGINKKEYTVLGDTVNTASRLESSVAKPMQVVVGENTYNATKAHFDFRSLGPATLEGQGADGRGVRSARADRHGRGRDAPVRRLAGSIASGERRRPRPGPPRRAGRLCAFPRRGPHPPFAAPPPLRGGRGAAGGDVVPPRVEEPRDPGAGPEEHPARQGAVAVAAGLDLPEEPAAADDRHRAHPRGRHPA